MHARRINDEVYVADQPVVRVAAEDVTTLKRLAGDTRRRRVRLCAHARNEDALHEMLIVLHQGTYVRPHRHLNKSESFHLIDGALTVVLFDDFGQIRDIVKMSSYASGGQFYYRLAEPAYHTVLLDSTQAVIHETTNGPFNRSDTDLAPWSPAEEDVEGAGRYQAELRERMARRERGER
jgi:cupin fold WbuC family metalloprotein